MSNELKRQLDLVEREAYGSAKTYPFRLWERLIPKQKECVSFRTTYGAMMGGNQVGKSTSAILRLRFHCTGEYPEDWTGNRTVRGQDIWFCGDRWSSIRDSIQKKMFGDDLENPGKVEPGKTPPMFLAEQIVGRPRYAPNSGGAIESIRIRHKSGGVSEITFKTYHMGIEGLASATVDGVCVDEECPLAILQEISMRILVKRGWVYCTFTPLLGRSEYYKFLESLDPRYGTVHFISQDEVRHLTAEMIAAMEAAFKGNPGQLQARRTGKPVMASGLIYPFDSEDLWIDWFPMNENMPIVAGLDIGMKTVAVPIAVDQNTGDHFVYAGYDGEVGKDARHHHFAMRDTFGDINFSVDLAANQRNAETSNTMLQAYNKLEHGEEFDRRIRPEDWKYRTVPNRSFRFGYDAIVGLLSAGKLWFLKDRHPGDPMGTLHLRNQFEEAVWDDRGLNIADKHKFHWLDALRYAVVGIGYAKTPRARRGIMFRNHVQPATWAPIPGNTRHR